MQLQQFNNETSNRFVNSKVSLKKGLLKAAAPTVDKCSGSSYCNNGGNAGSASSCPGSKHTLVSVDCVQNVYTQTTQYIYDLSRETLDNIKTDMTEVFTTTANVFQQVMNESIDGFSQVMDSSLTYLEKTTIFAISRSSAILTANINDNIEKLANKMNDNFNITYSMQDQLMRNVIQSTKELSNQLNILSGYIQRINDLYGNNLFAKRDNSRQLLNSVSQLITQVLELQQFSDQGVNISPLLAKWNTLNTTNTFQDVLNNTYKYASDVVIGVYPKDSIPYYDVFEDYNSYIYECSYTPIDSPEANVQESFKSEVTYYNESLPRGSLYVDDLVSCWDTNSYPKGFFYRNFTYCESLSESVSPLYYGQKNVSIYLNVDQYDPSVIPPYSIITNRMDYLGRNISDDIYYRYSNTSYIYNITNSVVTILPIYNNKIYLSSVHVFQSEYKGSRYNNITQSYDVYVKTINDSIYSNSVTKYEILNCISSFESLFIERIDTGDCILESYRKSSTSVDTFCTTANNTRCCIQYGTFLAGIRKTNPNRWCYPHTSQLSSSWYMESVTGTYPLPGKSYLETKVTTNTTVYRTLDGGMLQGEYFYLDHDTLGSLKIEQCKLVKSQSSTILSENGINYGLLDKDSKLVDTTFGSYVVASKSMSTLGLSYTDRVRVLTYMDKDTTASPLDIDKYYYTKDIWCCDKYMTPNFTVASTADCPILNATLCPTTVIDGVRYYKSPRIYYCSKDRKHASSLGVELSPCMKSEIKLPGQGVSIETGIQSPEGLYPADCIFWNDVTGKVKVYEISGNFTDMLVPTSLNNLKGKKIAYSLQGQYVIDEMSNLYGIGNSGYDCITYEMDKMLHNPRACANYQMIKYDSVAYFSSRVKSSGISRYMDTFDIMPIVENDNTLIFNFKLKSLIDYEAAYVDYLVGCPSLKISYNGDGCVLSGWSVDDPNLMIGGTVVKTNTIFLPSFTIRDNQSVDVVITKNAENITCNIVQCLASKNSFLAYPPNDAMVVTRPYQYMEQANTNSISIHDKLDTMVVNFTKLYDNYTNTHKNISNYVTINFTVADISDVLDGISSDVAKMKIHLNTTMESAKENITLMWADIINKTLSKIDEITNATIGELDKINQKYNITVESNIVYSDWSFDAGAASLGSMLGLVQLSGVIILIVVLVVIYKCGGKLCCGRKR